MPRVDIDVYTVVIKEFAKAVGVSKNKGVILVLDQAGWHSKKELPEGIELEFLPRACGYDKSEIARIGYQNQTSQSQDSYLLENVNSKKNCRIAYICEKL